MSIDEALAYAKTELACPHKGCPVTIDREAVEVMVRWIEDRRIQEADDAYDEFLESDASGSGG